jgi:integrase
VRNSELTHLKVSDIDGKRMVIHILGGKGRKDRAVMLSPKLLEELREHWRRWPRKSSTWLFPGNRWHNRDQPIDTKTPGTPVRRLPSAQASRNKSIPTPCVTATPRIFSKRGADQTAKPQVLLGYAQNAVHR